MKNKPSEKEWAMLTVWEIFFLLGGYWIPRDHVKLLIVKERSGEFVS